MQRRFQLRLGRLASEDRSGSNKRSNKTKEQKRIDSMQPGVELCKLFGIAPPKDNRTELQKQCSERVKAYWAAKKAKAKE